MAWQTKIKKFLANSNNWEPSLAAEHSLITRNIKPGLFQAEEYMPYNNQVSKPFQTYGGFMAATSQIIRKFLLREPLEFFCCREMPSQRFWNWAKWDTGERFCLDYRFHLVQNHLEAMSMSNQKTISHRLTWFNRRVEKNVTDFLTLSNHHARFVPSIFNFIQSKFFSQCSLYSLSMVSCKFV